MEEILNVYLAGKIECNGWRQQLIDIRNDDDLHSIRDEGNYQLLKSKRIEYADGILITGPFFISCDHGCYHGEHTHGVGGGDKSVCNSPGPSETEVIDICLTQIKCSNVVFAYINADSCYGSLFEIGYAASLGLPILLLFDTEQRKKDMWFISKYADFVGILGSGNLSSFFNGLLLKSITKISLMNPQRQINAIFEAERKRFMKDFGLLTK